MKSIILNVILPFCLIAFCGCATVGTSKQTEIPKVQTLDASLSALKKEFNREPSKPRLLALFSPTCGGCIHGAKALQHATQEVPRVAEGTELLVVWVYMLDSDNEAEARQAAERFNFPGARHFYDGENEVGRLLRAEQFPHAIREALEILPPDHPMRKSLEKRKDLPPEKMRVWDSVLIFPPGEKWDTHTPKPYWWTIQTGSRIEEKSGESKVVFWKNKRPTGSDWYPEAKEALEVAQSLAGSK